MVVWPVVVSWLLWCPVWVLFLLFNIIGSSPAWFVSKKKKIPLKSLEVDVGVTQVGSLDGNQDQTSAVRGLPFEF